MDDLKEGNQVPHKNSWINEQMRKLSRQQRHNDGASRSCTGTGPGRVAETCILIHHLDIVGVVGTSPCHLLMPDTAGEFLPLIAQGSPQASLRDVEVWSSRFANKPAFSGIACVEAALGKLWRARGYQCDRTF
jgi:hypothetical protein